MVIRLFPRPGFDRRRLVLLGGFIAAVALTLEIRLVQLQIARHAEADRKVSAITEETLRTSPPRGAIVDRNDRPFAIGEKRPSIYVDPKMADAGDTGLIAETLELPPAMVSAALARDSHFVWLKRGAEEAQWLALQRAGLDERGVRMIEETVRLYPQGNLAGAVLGRVGHDNAGLAGVEYARQPALAGEGRVLIARRDARGRLIEWRTVKAGREGADLRLTLDAALQYRAESELAAAVQRTGAQGGLVAVMKPETGELLAMASWPPYNPLTGGIPHNAVAEMAYEPGSTFKAFTVLAALNENKTRPDEVIFCENGGLTVNGQYIKDHKPFGNLTVEKIIAESSDVGVMKLALRVGATRFDEYMRDFGFGARTGSGLPGESAGIFAPVEKWSGRSLATLAMGQEIAVSPLQLLSAYSAIANGGRLVVPRLFMDEAPHPARQIRVRPAVLAQMREMLNDVVSEGTGKKAAIPGVRSGGKTGTAQKALNGHYLDGKYFASFIGFFPLEKPIAVALVVIDEPRVGMHHGGEAAAPVFGALARDIYIHARAAAPVDPPPPATTPLAQTAVAFPVRRALPGGGI